MPQPCPQAKRSARQVHVADVAHALLPRRRLSTACGEFDGPGWGCSWGDRCLAGARQVVQEVSLRPQVQSVRCVLAGLVGVYLHLAALLLLNPFVRSVDDRLAVYAQATLITVLLGGSLGLSQPAMLAGLGAALGTSAGLAAGALFDALPGPRLARTWTFVIATVLVEGEEETATAGELSVH